MRCITFVVVPIIRLYNRVMDWYHPPLDLGKHGILINRGDHYSPMTDDEMWEVMSAVEEQLTERWWENEFLRGAKQHGDAVFTMH